MNLTITKKLLFGFLFTLLLMIVVCYIAYANIHQLLQAEQNVKHTHKVIFILENMLSQIKDAETGQRGYLLTGVDKYLVHYNKVLKSGSESLDHLYQLTRDNPNQSQRVQQVTLLIKKKFTELNHTIQLRKTEGFEAALAVVLTDEGEDTMDEIRAVITKMEVEERFRLNQRTEQVDKQANLAMISIILVTLFAGVSVTILGILISKSIKDQLTELKNAMQGVIKKGELQNYLDVKSRDEIGETANIYNNLVDSLQTVLDEIAVLLCAASKGDFTKRINLFSKRGFFLRIGHDLNQLMEVSQAGLDNVHKVLDAIRKGDLTKTVEGHYDGTLGELKAVTNDMVENLRHVLEEIDYTIEEAIAGKLDARIRLDFKSGFYHQLSSNLNKLFHSSEVGLTDVIRVLSAMSAGNLTAKIEDPHAGAFNLLKDYCNNTILKLKESHERLAEDNWYKTNYSKILVGLQGGNNVIHLIEAFLEIVCVRIDAYCGVFYLVSECSKEQLDDNDRITKSIQYELMATYGGIETAQHSFRLGEGTIGNCAESQLPLMINVPMIMPKACQIQDGLGVLVPSVCFIVPIIYENKTIGVVELASQSTFSNIQKKLLLQLSENLGVMLKAKISEAALLKSQEMVFESTKMAALGKMASNMAHEINSPLLEISLISDRIQRMLGNKAIDHQAISDTSQQIANSVQRISTIIDSLRHLARESDNDPFEFCAIDIILDDAVGMSSEKFRVNGITFNIDYNNVKQSTQIECRRIQISQIMINLFNNAFDAILLLHEKWITVSLQKIDGIIRIAVTDSGNGISEQQQLKIFEPMYTSKAIGEGTGLGLSVSRAIAQSHHGRLIVDSACDHTRFVLELPLQQSLQQVA